jgi:hypothetical protein
MKRLLATAALASALAACTTTGAGAPTPAATATAPKSPYESEILATVDRFLLAIGNHDDEALEEVLITEGVSWIQTLTPGNERPVQPYTNASVWARSRRGPVHRTLLGSNRHRARRPRAGLGALELRDNGEQVHCGIDAFDLVFLDGAWRIASVLSRWSPKPARRWRPLRRHASATAGRKPATNDPPCGWISQGGLSKQPKKLTTKINSC